MHVSYLINVSDYANPTEFHEGIVTDYVAAQLARSHSAPTGTGDDNQISAIDVLTRIGSHRVMSFLVPVGGSNGARIHPLQMMAAKGEAVHVDLYAKKKTLVKPNPQVTVAGCVFNAKIQSIFPLRAGYEVNLTHVANFWLNKVTMDENEVAARDKIVADLQLALARQQFHMRMLVWQEESKKQAILDARPKAPRQDQEDLDGLFKWLRPR